MTLLRNIIRLTDNILSSKTCFVLNRNTWNAENCFATSKIVLPSPPKRPLTAYMIFCKENRKDVLKVNPSLSTPEQIKALAQKWNLLTEDMKKPYEVSARQHTQLYGEEHKKFYESLTEEQKEELSRMKAKKIESRRLWRNKKTLRDAGLPKGPISAYSLFVQSEAKKKPKVQYPNCSYKVLYNGVVCRYLKRTLEIIKSLFNHREFLKKVADQWNSLPEESKKVFEKQAEEDKKRYAREMKEWRDRMLQEDNKRVLKAYEEIKKRDLESGELSSKKAAATKEKKKPDSAPAPPPPPPTPKK